MKLQNFNKTLSSSSLNNSLKEKFGYRLNLDELPLDRAQKMLVSVDNTLNEAVQKAGEKARSSKVYAEKKLIAETLTQFVAEKKKTIAMEQRRAILKRKLNEAEQQEAEVVLAAKDMVDRMQKMVEDLGEMQNEQILPLVDQIRQTLGDETASSFESSMTAAVTSAMDAVRQARTDADGAARILSGGEAPDNMMGGETDDMEVGGEEPMADIPADAEEPAAEPETDAAPEDDGEVDMGREKRDDVELDLSGL